jgi:mRNA interferase RelE/StbE
MNLRIDYSKQSIKFLKKNSHLLTIEQVDDLIIKAMKRLLKNENIAIDLKSLQGDKKGYYRIRVGNIRIIFSFLENQLVIASVENIGFRGDIYK